MSPEIREAIEDACESQVAITGYEFGNRRKPISFESAADLIRRFAQNIPSHMTIADLSDEMGHAANQRHEP